MKHSLAFIAWVLAWIAPLEDRLEKTGLQARGVKQIINRVGQASRCLL